MIAVSLLLYVAPAFHVERTAVDPEDIKLHGLLLSTHLEEVSRNLGLLQEDGWDVLHEETSPYHLVLVHHNVKTRQQALTRLRSLGIDLESVMLLED